MDRPDRGVALCAPHRHRSRGKRLFSGARRTRGYVAAMVAVGLTALLGVAALSVDVGRVMMAAQRAQDVADAAAFAGGSLLRVPADAIVAAQQCVAANNQSNQGFPITCTYVADSTTSDIRYFAPYTYVPDYGWLGWAAKAIRVTTHVTVPYTFGRAVGLTEKQITRRATAVRAPVGGCPIAPLWVSHPTEYKYGEYQNLLMADGPHYAEIPGNFGWLALPPEVDASWVDVLSGIPLSDADTEALFCDIGDYVTGYPGLAVGQWVAGLESRITRAQAGWAGETWDNCSANNPRIVIVPLVTYVSGTGSGATFQIVKFGAFWLDFADSSGNPKHIDGRFIRYTLPGAGIEPLSDDVGLFSYRLAG